MNHQNRAIPYSINYGDDTYLCGLLAGDRTISKSMEIYKPRKELLPYVRYYWTIKCDEPFSVPTYPIGCPQIIFHKKQPLIIPELNKKQSVFTISGQVNFPTHIQSDGNLDMLVAVFYPYTIGMFINTPPSDFYNLEISGYDLGNMQLNEVAGKIFDGRDNRECIGILEQWLVTKIDPSYNLIRIRHSLGKLLNMPQISVNRLAESSCLGKKQYERIFREYVGMNPKEFARVVRFQKSLWLMQCGDRNFAGIAAECGYSDQSHFIREFRNMSSYTPKAMVDKIVPYSDLFSNPA